ncbi:transposase, partial [Thermosulfurimonas sp. F29]|uniref:transposase n=1 Tax=Thermosulfurimonas sp. F29 TaxID=2867247 RepID=UPI001C83A5D6
QSVSEGEEIIMEIADLVEKEKPKKAREIREKTANYTAFLNYPKKVRKHIYTTNPVEGLNRGLELMRLELGGYFPSQECLEVNLFVQAVNLADKWQRRPIPTVASMEYELRQLFVLRYESEEV